MRKYKQQFMAGAYVNPSDGGTNSLTALNVSSQFTASGNKAFTGATSIAGMQVNSIEGGAGWRGIATMNSGTVVASVSATAARSGAVIHVTPIQYTSDLSSQAFKGIAVQSVRAGAFEIVALSSLAPVGDMPVAWSVIR